MKKKTAIMAMLAACMVLVSCNKQPKPEDNPGGGEEVATETMKILYWNTQNGMWADQGNNYETLAAFVKRIDPDVCIWLEAGTIYQTGTNTTVTTTKYLPDNWDKVAAKYGHSYAISTYMKNNYPQEITSKYKITKRRDLIGDASNPVTTAGGHFKISWKGKSINIVTVHLAPNAADNEKRENEIKYICGKTVLESAKAKDEYWLMAGDFNCKSQVDDFFYNLGNTEENYRPHKYIKNYTPYKDVIAEKYPNQFKPTMYHNSTRLDYIYCTPPLLDLVSSIEIVRTIDEWGAVRNDSATGFKIPSDHYPIIIEFKTKN